MLPKDLLKFLEKGDRVIEMLKTIITPPVPQLQGLMLGSTNNAIFFDDAFNSTATRLAERLQVEREVARRQSEYEQMTSRTATTSTTSGLYGNLSGGMAAGPNYWRY